MGGKSLFRSKTFWVNTLAFAAMFAQGWKGWVISPESQIGLLTVINVILRLVTKEQITWS